MLEPVGASVGAPGSLRRATRSRGSASAVMSQRQYTRLASPNGVKSNICVQNVRIARPRRCSRARAPPAHRARLLIGIQRVITPPSVPFQGSKRQLARAPRLTLAGRVVERADVLRSIVAELLEVLAVAHERVRHGSSRVSARFPGSFAPTAAPLGSYESATSCYRAGRGRDARGARGGGNSERGSRQLGDRFDRSVCSSR